MFVSVRKLTRYLQPLAEATRDGVDLTVSLEEKNSLGWIGQIMKVLLGRFHDSLVKIASTAIHLSQQAPELAKLSKLLEERARAQQSNAENIGAASHTLAETVQSISKSASEASAFSQQVAQAAKSANSSDLESRQQIQAIGDSTQALEEQMTLLKTSSASISEVVELIKNIADRTRLLSLNAALEAARAGEQGRGFAVVADEVRKLADQTMSATQNVEELLDTIQQQVTSSSDTMVAMSKQVHQGITVSQAAGASIEAASRDITTLIEHVRTIADASGSQTEKVNAIANQITEVVDSTHQQLEDARELANRAALVSDKCDSLLTEVGVFRFSGHRRTRIAVEEEVAKWQLSRLSADDLDRKLVALNKREPAFEMLCIQDTSGQQISSDVVAGVIDTDGRKNNWKEKRWFTEPMRQRRVFVSDLYRSIDTNDYCFTVGTPLFDQKQNLLGVLCADVKFTNLLNM
jgi:methyl-accepting chemotaxis protein